MKQLNQSLADKISSAEQKKEALNEIKEFDVTIIETLKMTVTVEANSLEEAKQLVSDNWHNQDYILDADNFTGVEFEAKEVKEQSKSVDREER